MDEIELRLAAVELLLIETMAWQDRAILEDAGRSIQAGIDAGCDPEEATVRKAALQLIEDAWNRYSRTSRPPAV